MKGLVPYLYFDGNARHAMTFYQRCMGGTLEIKTFAELPQSAPETHDRILHSCLVSGHVTLMASDTMPGSTGQRGDNFAISLSCDSMEEIEKLYVALSERGEATHPLHQSFWGERFGMLTDQFGIHWMLSLEKGLRL